MDPDHTAPKGSLPMLDHIFGFDNVVSNFIHIQRLLTFSASSSLHKTLEFCLNCSSFLLGFINIVLIRFYLRKQVSYPFHQVSLASADGAFSHNLLYLLCVHN